jgi:predicted N-formylglutamate amidohydrolase
MELLLQKLIAEASRKLNALGQDVAEVTNAGGGSPFVLVCDHAAHFIPPPYGDMGLTADERLSHIAWDPGALEVSRGLSQRLDAPLVASGISRLVIDANRDVDSPALFWTLSEATRIAANENLPAAERRHRIDTYYRPYHAAIDRLLARRQDAGRETILVCIHSFTPVFLGVARPWEIGLIHGQDERFTRDLQAALATATPGLTIGWNEPYAARNGVTFTLEHHGDARGIEATMIEIRNDEIGEPAGVARWADRLAGALTRAAATPRAGAEPGGADPRSRSHA